MGKELLHLVKNLAADLDRVNGSARYEKNQPVGTELTRESSTNLVVQRMENRKVFSSNCFTNFSLAGSLESRELFRHRQIGRI